MISSKSKNTKNLIKKLKKGLLLRKVLHLIVGTGLAVAFYFVNKDLYLSILFTLSIATMLGYSFKLDRLGIIKKVFFSVRKKNEFVAEGMLTLISSFIIIAILLEKHFLLFTWLIIFSDTMASLGGKMFGKTFIGTKTLEGTLFYIISSLPAYFLSTLSLESFLLLVILSSLVELSDKIEDNIGIAVLGALILSLNPVPFFY